MSYDPSALSLGFDLLGGKYRVWVYKSTDQFSDVDATDYFSNASAAGMQEGDTIFVIETDQDPPTVTLGTVSALDADGNGTVTAYATAGSPSFVSAAMTSLTVTTEANIGGSSAALVGFHGVPAVDQAALVTLEVTVSGSVIASRVKSIIALLIEKGLMASA